MPIFHAFVLGLVQGLSEFLPISSSAHLLLAPWLFGWNDFADKSIEKAFDVALHLGTLVAVVVYFRHDLARYIRAGAHVVAHRQRPLEADGRVAWLLLLSTIPAAAIGAAFQDTIDERLGTPTIIAVSMIVFAVLLGLSDRMTGRRVLEDFRSRDAIVVGAAQALALNPGTSRSGITITGARQEGFDRDSAVRLSFLMGIPVTAGAVLLKMAGLAADGIPDGLVVPMVVGIVTSAVSGWFAVWGLLRFVRTRTFAPFVAYRIVLGVVVLIIVATGWR
jgi:undecaprenyl-diphosphatase